MEHVLMRNLYMWSLNVREPCSFASFRQVSSAQIDYAWMLHLSSISNSVLMKSGD